MKFFHDWLREVRIIVTIIGIVLLLGWVGSIRSCAHRSSEQVVSQVAERLDALVESGHYRQVPQVEITETDAWGQRLNVEYREEGVGQRLMVSSAGRDGSFGTRDDIVATRWLLNAKGIGESVRGQMASTAEEGSRGAIRGAKQEIKKSLKRAFRRDGAEP